MLFDLVNLHTDTPSLIAITCSHTHALDNYTIYALVHFKGNQTVSSRVCTIHMVQYMNNYVRYSPCNQVLFSQSMHTCKSIVFF